MVAITLPDGGTRTYDGPVSAAEVAADIGPGLARAAVMARVDGADWDLARPIEGDCRLEIIRRADADALPLLRHDAAHVLAMAVQELFPGTQITFGPATADGFYYDFHRETPFSSDDFAAIEARMADIVDRDLTITREVWRRQDAADLFREQGEVFKAEWVAELPAGEDISMYRQGDWIDLCRGPHLPSTGRLGKAFKLMKLAGAYWRGDATRPQLQRIYGTCWRDEKELNAYLTRLAEAERRDHRKLATALDLFHLQEEARGAVFWHPKGWTLYRTCRTYMRRRLDGAGYQEVNTPQLVDRSLWLQSGHWEKYRENMFIAEVDEGDSPGGGDGGDNTPDGTPADGRHMLALKPMNCPCHVQIFRQGIKSYRDLPLRMSEFGACHRHEPSGALHGLMRVRAFTQDDAHIFCSEDQIEAETGAFIDLLASIYRDFGFTEFVIQFSDRPPVRAGSDVIWDKAESALENAARKAGVEVVPNPGDGAFYGPKLDFVLRDAIGRDWQCGTFQVDFVLPERLDAHYVDADGAKRRPVMLHRAILGSFERFIGILIEQYAGHFPLWLAPLQCIVATITHDADAYATEVAARCRQHGLRVETDLRNEKINLKVREHSLMKIPVILVVGRKEAEGETVALRRLGGKAQEILALDKAIHILCKEAAMPDGS